MLAENWKYRPIRNFAHPTDKTVQTGPFGAQLHSEDYVDEGVPFILIKNMKGEHVSQEDMPCITEQDAKRLAAYRLNAGDIVFSRVGRVGSCFLVSEEEEGWVISGQLLRLRLDYTELCPKFLLHWIRSFYVERHILNESVGSTRQSINSSILANLPVPNIPKDEQIVIANILDTLDTKIRQTEAIIAKLQQVKQGLLHDLLTRGINESGQLRPPYEQAPELYKDSPLGWIPKEWGTPTINDVVESLSDGPFGSNLKTEHYVEFEGVRVIRLQNISAGKYDDADRAFISFKHAGALHRNKVISGDVLVASLGDQNHPVGRACLYPNNFPNAINKADCFRLRAKDHCRNAFLTLALNSASARKQVSGYEQGVTLKRINTSNLRKVIIPLPLEQEQAAIECRYKSVDIELAYFEDEILKLKKQKAGLMDDLLTGRVRVTELIDQQQQASQQA